MGKNSYSLNRNIHKNKIENRITLKIKTGCYLELLTPEAMKLLGSPKNKITNNKNGENICYLEITEVLLMHCNVQESCKHLSIIVEYLSIIRYFT